MPERHIASYLRAIQVEASHRGYRFDAQRIGGEFDSANSLVITDGQLAYEWAHLSNKLTTRAPNWLAQFGSIRTPEAHPLFRTVAGEIAHWEADRSTFR